MKKEILFEEIDPYVRYAKVLQLGPGYDTHPVRAYDNRLLYIFDGSAVLTLNGHTYRAERGGLWLWTSDDTYSVKAASENGVRVLLVNFDYTSGSKGTTLAIPTDSPERFRPSLRTEDLSFKDAPAFNEPISLSDTRSLEVDLLNLDHEFVSPQKNYVMMLSSMMKTLLIKIARKMIAETGGVNSSILVDQVIAYIQENYRQDISNASIGQKFNYHPNYINRSILYATGQSLHQYVIGVRIMKALELIQVSDLSMTEIAKAVGFKSIKHFSQSFKKVYGFSPTHFKSKG